ncbi:MAG: amino acid permease, partial [Gemmatimonadetes bacterium]|nr:amino acid permease [Gemmatimonadota bacterium]
LYLDPEHFRPLNPTGEPLFNAITATAALTLWAFTGLESATIPAEAVKDPGRTIPRATLIGVLTAAVIYLLATVGVMGILPATELADSTAPFADAGRAIWGSRAGSLIAAGAAISAFGALNGWVLLQGQWPMAAARDGLFPPVFGKISRRGVPVAGMVLSSLLVTGLMALNFTSSLVDQFTFIILLATLSTLIPYVFSAVAELVIFVRERENFRGERLAGASVIAVIALLYSLWAITGTGLETVLWGLVLMVAGLPIYWWQTRRSR